MIAKLHSKKRLRNLFTIFETFAEPYFWRTNQQQEIDYIEQKEQQLTAYEFKWKTEKAAKIPRTFSNHYQAQGHIIHRGNFREFVKISSETA